MRGLRLVLNVTSKDIMHREDVAEYQLGQDLLKPPRQVIINLVIINNNGCGLKRCEFYRGNQELGG